jgi:hypothetical protein
MTRQQNPLKSSSARWDWAFFYTFLCGRQRPRKYTWIMLQGYMGRMCLVARLCFILMAATLCSCTRAPENPIPAYDYERYSLFTWKTQTDGFCFAIMVRADADKFLHSRRAKESARCGVFELKRALTALPRLSHVFWEDWPPKQFDYPPDSVVEEVIDFAKSRGIHLEQSPALR